MGKWKSKEQQEKVQLAHGWTRCTENQGADVWDGWDVRDGDLDCSERGYVERLLNDGLLIYSPQSNPQGPPYTSIYRYNLVGLASTLSPKPGEPEAANKTQW